MVTSHVLANPAQTVVDEKPDSAPAAAEIKSDDTIALILKRAKPNQLTKILPDNITIALILKLAKANPKAEGVEKGLTWVLRGAKPAQLKEISAILLTHYKDSKSLRTVAMSYGRMRQGGEAELKKIIEKAGDETVRQGATYYLAAKLVKNAETKADGLAMMKKLVATPGIDKSNPRLLSQAEGQIYVIEKLAIGCTAPDIVGKDEQGKEFKLSDYRGKAVLVDFWGIW